MKLPATYTVPELPDNELLKRQMLLRWISITVGNDLVSCDERLIRIQTMPSGSMFIWYGNKMYLGHIINGKFEYAPEFNGRALYPIRDDDDV